jgi:hypothetical protein
MHGIIQNIYKLYMNSTEHATETVSIVTFYTSVDTIAISLKLLYK